MEYEIKETPNHYEFRPRPTGTIIDQMSPVIVVRKPSEMHPFKADMTARMIEKMEYMFDLLNDCSIPGHLAKTFLPRWFALRDYIKLGPKKVEPKYETMKPPSAKGTKFYDEWELFVQRVMRASKDHGIITDEKKMGNQILDDMTNEELASKLQSNLAESEANMKDSFKTLNIEAGMMMIFDISPRQSGKTTRAVEWLKADPENRAIVVLRHNIKRDLMSQYKLKDNQIITFDSLLNHTWGKTSGGRQIFIDNAEHLLNSLCDHKLEGFSASTNYKP